MTLPHGAVGISDHTHFILVIFAILLTANVCRPVNLQIQNATTLLHINLQINRSIEKEPIVSICIEIVGSHHLPRYLQPGYVLL